jgi:PAS domain S-box-containing protein
VYIWDVSQGLENIVEEYVSPQIERVLGFHPNEWMANPKLWIDRIHPEDRPRVIGETARCVETGRPFKLEYRMLAKGGRVVWLHDVASVLARDDTGQSYRYQGVQLDITDRKDAEDAQRRGAEELRRFEQQRRELLESLVTTQETERRRIADGIHDDTIQSLFGLQMRLSAIATRYPELEQLEDFPQLRQELLDAMAGLRNLTFELHPDILETEGLVPALRLHVERWKTPDAPELIVVDRLERQPSKETRSMMYRIAQEALTNVRKHSHARRITVSLEHRDRGFRVVIEDDGDGFDAERAPRSDRDHLGLTSMRQRAEMAGGWSTVRSGPGAGTTVEIWLPDADSG